MYAVVRTEGGNSFPFPRSLPAVLAAMGFIWNGSKCPPGGMPLLNWLIGLRPITYVGRISYPLYLWHWPIFVLTKWSVGLDEPGPRLGALFATVLAAVFTYHGPEALARKWRPKKQRHVFIVALVAVGSLEAVLSCLRIPLRAPRPPTAINDALTASLPPPPPSPPLPLRSPPPPLPSPPLPLPPPPPSVPLDWPQTPPLPAPPPPSPSPLPSPFPPQQTICACQNPPGPDHLLHEPPGATSNAAELCFDGTAVLHAGPHLGDASKIWKWPVYKDCWIGSTATSWNAATKARILPCLAPDRGGTTTPKRSLFLIGDSHGASFMLPVQKVAHLAGMAFAWVGRSACGLTGPCPYDDERVTNEYQAAVQSALLSQLQPGDIVILLQWKDNHIRQSSVNWYGAPTPA